MLQTATIQQAISNQMRQQAVQPISDSMKSQPVKQKDRPDPIPPPDDLQRLAGYNNPWSWFLLGLMFANAEQLKQMREDAAAILEMTEVDERYDRQMIRMSGFEW